MRYIVTVGGRVFEVEVESRRVTVAGRTHAATLAGVPGATLRQLLIDGRPLNLAIEGSGRGRWGITARGERWESEVVDERTRYIRGLTGGSDQRRGGGAIKAPMPGLVVRVRVEPGQAIAAGAGVVVLEAMKMENELKAAAPGVVRAVLVRAGEAVEKGQLLVEFDGQPLG